MLPIAPSTHYAHKACERHLALDALEQAVNARPLSGPLVHHSDRGVLLGLRYTERLAAAGIEPSVGRVGDSYDCDHVPVAVGPGLTPAMIDFVSWR